MLKLLLRFGLLAVLFFVLTELGKYAMFSSGSYQEFLIVLMAMSFVAFGFILRSFWVSRKQILANPTETSQEKLALLKISEREFEVLLKLAEGLSNQEIASKLFISENTVKTHISRIFEKLNARRRTEAISKAKEYGLL